MLLLIFWISVFVVIMLGLGYTLNLTTRAEEFRAANARHAAAIADRDSKIKELWLRITFLESANDKLGTELNVTCSNLDRANDKTISLSGINAGHLSNRRAFLQDIEALKAELASAKAEKERLSVDRAELLEAFGAAIKVREDVIARS